MNDATDGTGHGSGTDESHHTKKNYDVGYKKPPAHTRFRSGEKSPNPAGRPKGARNLKTDFLEEADTVMSVNDGGVRRTLSKQRIAMNSLTTLAMKGNMRSCEVC